ncbi:MAG: creatininase family protein [Trueperaceae bacterium]
MTDPKSRITRDITNLHRYVDHTWPEIGEAAALNKVVVLPVGSVEDHGYHLPLDMDHQVEKICLEAGRRRPDLFLIAPLIPYGFNLHHLDWPGTVHVASETFIAYCLDVCKSFAHHGFKKILIMNGHGSNMPNLDIVARKVVLETGAHCAATIWTNLCMEAFGKMRETQRPGSGHADEIETSLYLHLDESRVQMDKAVKEIPESWATSKYFYLDLEKGSPVLFMDWWTRWNVSGVVGDPTVATKEKGEILWEETIANMIEMAEEFRGIPLKDRVDYHAHGTGDAKLDA